MLFGLFIDIRASTVLWTYFAVMDGEGFEPLVVLATIDSFHFSINGWRRIRTFEVVDNRFTVCPLWPLGNPSILSSSHLTSIDYTSIPQKMQVFFYIFYKKETIYFPILNCCLLICYSRQPSHYWVSSLLFFSTAYFKIMADFAGMFTWTLPCCTGCKTFSLE